MSWDKNQGIKNDASYLDPRVTQAETKLNDHDVQLAQTAKEISPILFGAIGDGINDDRVALVNTINYAIENGIGVNLGEDKTYLINSMDGSLNGSNANIFEITGKLTLRGKSTIKLGAIGDYESVFRLREGSSGTVFRDFILDENTNENPTTENEATSLSAHIGKRRIAFYGWNTTHINILVFERITIKNCLGVWQIQGKANDVSIDNITIEYEQNNNGVNPAYDRTCIYMTGSKWILRDSVFIGSALAKTLIETHGTHMTVDNNHGYNFHSMLYIVNDIQSGFSTLDKINIVNNDFRCRAGLRFWFSVDNCNIGNVNVVNNILQTTTDSRPCIMTWSEQGNNVNVKNIKIDSNTIIGELETHSFIEIVSPQNTVGNGSVVYENFVIQNNIFKGSARRCVHLTVQPAKLQTIKNLIIQNNNFILDMMYFHSLIYLLDTPNGFEKIEIRNNSFEIKDKANPSSGLRIFDAQHEAGRTFFNGNVFLKNNEYKVPTEVRLDLSNVNGSNFLNVDETFKRKITDMQIDSRGAYNGIIRDVFGQSVTYQEGVRNRQIFYMNALPTQNPYKIGDIVYNTNPTVGGVDYWKCVISGSPGSWRSQQLGVLNNINSVPLGVGFIAISAGIMYGSVGTNSVSDWKPITS